MPTFDHYVNYCHQWLRISPGLVESNGFYPSLFTEILEPKKFSRKTVDAKMITDIIKDWNKLLRISSRVNYPSPTSNIPKKEEEKLPHNEIKAKPEVKEGFTVKQVSDEIILGIDLGSSAVRVAVFRNGNVEMIPNEAGNIATPMYIAISEKGTIIGEAALSLAFDPKNVFYDFKRLLGRKYDEHSLSERNQWWFFDVELENNRPILVADCNGKKTRYHPEELVAMVLFEMKEVAQKFLKTKVSKAVITVPSFYNECQRQALLDAGIILKYN
jgi:hypothetical protein